MVDLLSVVGDPTEQWSVTNRETKHSSDELSAKLRLFTFPERLAESALQLLAHDCRRVAVLDVTGKHKHIPQQRKGPRLS